ncbi:MAG: hypothetical protein AAB789_00755 [Patescibacteria group bacterium]
MLNFFETPDPEVSVMENLWSPMVIGIPLKENATQGAEHFFFKSKA